MRRKVSKKSKPIKERRKEFYELVETKNLALNDAILEYRHMLGMTRKEFSEFTGVSERIIKEFENEVSKPTLTTIERLIKGSGLKITLKRP